MFSFQWASEEKLTNQTVGRRIQACKCVYGCLAVCIVLGVLGYSIYRVSVSVCTRACIDSAAVACRVARCGRAVWSHLCWLALT